MKTSRRRGEETLNAVADDIVAMVDDGVTQVAVDGVDGVGKTVFADELAAVLQSRRLAVIPCIGGRIPQSEQHPLRPRSQLARIKV